MGLAGVTLDLGVRGQPAAMRLVEVMLASRRLPHALLFTGPPHSGKSTLMRGLAAYLNCAAAGPSGPCWHCPSCRRIADGVDFDVRSIEVEEGHGRIQIEQVREFERRVALTAVGGLFKIAMFPSAHLLTENAANALLKTLEQPPPHTLIMLAAPTRDAILTTVASRCSHLRLYPLAAGELRALVVERTDASGPDLELALEHAFGRPGWAIDILSKPGQINEFARQVETMLAAIGPDCSDADRLQTAADVATSGRSAAERRRNAIGMLEWLELALAARRLPDRLERWAADAATVRSGLTRLHGNTMVRPAVEAVFLALGRGQPIAGQSSAKT
ncbi:MAG: hypothetical protein F4Z80_01500 [Chloroflexi bacterium]|nr:hypothetical protein [Chloroflexota bacterium]MXY12714.1 hypothetical protein [Chloroflexota bacterium]MYC47686.1 hypothetical protein [Chloroflexota bacterium]